MTPETFNRAISRHLANLKPWRQSRLDEFFRNELLDDNGEIAIGQSRFHPADVLQMMKPTEHANAQSESRQRYQERLAEIVCEAFPSPIARPFDAFTNGPREPLRRLFHMKDTWEAATTFLHAMLLAECAGEAVDLSGSLRRIDDFSNPIPLRRRDLLDWRIATRLGLIEGVLVHAEQEEIELQCSSLIPIEVVTEMRRLNRVRNEFSHSQTKSDRQAEQIIGHCQDDLMDVLGDLQQLENIEMFRIDRIARSGSTALEVERLVGYAGARRVGELTATPEQVGRCLAKTPIRNFDRVLMKIGSEIYDASPFFYCSDDLSGHRTKLHMLSQHKPAEMRICFEVVAEADTVSEPDDEFKEDVDRIKCLIG